MTFRLFEGLLLAALTPALAGFSVLKRPWWATVAAGLALPLALVHLFVEGARWQMAPAYGVTLSLVVGIIRPAGVRSELVHSCSHLKLRAAGVVLGWLWIASTVLLCAAFPIFRLPAPTGSYSVGTTRLHLVDASRPETFTVDATDRRELLVQVWYPAEPETGGDPAVYWVRPPFFLNHLRFVPTHSTLGAPVARGDTPFPVLIFSHGYFLGYVSQNAAQMEDLASHGYVVVSIAHPHEALSVTFPDGRRVPFSWSHFGRILSLLPNQSELLALMDESHRIWTEDTVFVMDELRRMNAGDSPFSGSLDLSRLGVFGMSFGGATASEVCLVDGRCQAGVNMDGGLWGDALRGGAAVRRPFMVMYDEIHEGMNDEMYERVDGPAYRVTVQGTAHADFGDMTFMSPILKRTGILLGPIDDQRMVSIMNDYVRAFFDTHVKGGDASLLDGLSVEYPEVSLESRNR
jgi:predicted dienelactone hydrolase